jgi:predicted nucleotidyltransferase
MSQLNNMELPKIIEILDTDYVLVDTCGTLDTKLWILDEECSTDNVYHYSSVISDVQLNGFEKHSSLRYMNMDDLPFHLKDEWYNTVNDFVSPNWFVACLKDCAAVIVDGDVIASLIKVDDTYITFYYHDLHNPTKIKIDSIKHVRRVDEVIHFTGMADDGTVDNWTFTPLKHGLT